MKLLKTAGLLTVALIAAMAVFGAASAMATNTQLCSSDPSGTDAVCPSGSGITHLHLVDPLALVFMHSIGIDVDVLCELLFLGEVLGLAAPQIIHGNFTFGPPHGKGTKCVDMNTGRNCGEVKETSAGGLLLFLRIADEEAEVKFDGFKILVECVGVHCVYSLAAVGGTSKGALSTEEGELGATQQTLTSIEGFLCPSQSKITIHSKSLTALYIKL